MANIKDFAVGIVTSVGTNEVTLRPGEGSTMPAVPFYVTATPPGQLTTIGTSEKLLVTARTNDTLTYTGAQAPTTTKTIAAGWIIANAMYVDDVMNATLVMGGDLAGNVNGSNATFTLPSPTSAVNVYKNGVRMRQGNTNDYLFTNNNTITFNAGVIPQTGDVLTYDGIIGNQVNINGSNSFIAKESVSGAINGVNGTFFTQRSYVPGSLQAYINGLAQSLFITETNPATGEFTIDAPNTGDDVRVSYQHSVSASANADTVDGYHASATPTANQIPVLNASGKLPDSTNSQRHYMQLKQSANITATATAQAINFNTVDLSSGTKLTYSSNGVLIGDGVSTVRVTYSVMADTSSTAAYIYTLIMKGATSIGEQIDDSAQEFKSTSQTKMVSVASGDIITIRISTGPGSAVVPTSRQSSMLVEVVE